jgi:7,8-dihydropterin-6-yl-methyl-4-(beta-D-ribofuranosyl)aminobenzene 5'-phosphate synthase
VNLPEVDEVSVLTLVDNVFDALLPSGGAVTRPVTGTGRVPAPQFTSGQTAAGLRAEHGFSALVTVRRGEQSTTVLFDTGVSPDGLAVNAESLGLGMGDIQGVVLSHGHFDHAGGFPGLAPAARPVRPAADRAPGGLDPAPAGPAGRRAVRDAHALAGRAGT